MDEKELYRIPLPAVLKRHGSREPVERPTAEQLSDAVEAVGSSFLDTWLICSPLPEREEASVSVMRKADGGYILETRYGPGSRADEVEIPPGDTATEIFLERIRSWAPEEERAAIPTAAPPDVPLDPDVRAYAEQVATDAVRGGFLDFPEAVDEIVDSAEHDRPVAPVQARRLLQPIWEARAAEQEQWSGTSDNDRLDAAFAALEAGGITARQNFSCCRRCGTGEIGDERKEGDRGFVFYHSQDTDAASAGHGLHLAYGGFDGSEETTAAVGREVAAALAEAGLEPDWNGSPSKRILVPMEWRRPLPA
ncbi:hypothetical protein J0910_01460 [Nocardiopsis sp. CNT-189]|uniref:DUF6891 domain-containing protein n=1 Tax=Nocardiopsis oceanisediminis TaxID=2816862 RepID=UPI003B375DD6